MKWGELKKDERLAEVSKLAAKGLSANQIATSIGGISRNAIIGFMRRNDIKLARKRGDNRVEASIAKRKLALPPVPRPAAKVAIKTPAVNPEPLKIGRKNAFDPLPGVPPMPIADMPIRGRCRWPVNGEEGRAGIFCGSATSPVVAIYCRTHQHLSSH